jgi:hypothetical protein
MLDSRDRIEINAPVCSFFLFWENDAVRIKLSLDAFTLTAITSRIFWCSRYYILVAPWWVTRWTWWKNTENRGEVEHLIEPWPYNKVAVYTCTLSTRYRSGVPKIIIEFSAFLRGRGSMQFQLTFLKKGNETRRCEFDEVWAGTLLVEE